MARRLPLSGYRSKVLPPTPSTEPIFILHFSRCSSQRNRRRRNPMRPWSNCEIEIPREKTVKLRGAPTETFVLLRHLVLVTLADHLLRNFEKFHGSPRSLCNRVKNQTPIRYARTNQRFRFARYKSPGPWWVVPDPLANPLFLNFRHASPVEPSSLHGFPEP